MSEPALDAAGESRPFGWPRELDTEYELLGELGRGGMAVVYRARDRELGREVAIKVVRPRFHADEEAVTRLAREARTVAQLEHPNIVGLYAVKRCTDNSLALVMQLVPGRTLKAALEHEGPFPPQRAERVMRDIARALAYAHRCGVVHRDVKPENIFLDDVTGRALLSDFGVARQLDQSTELTATGTAIGTPTYMAPEQIDGGKLDGRSDLYSLGLVGWEMLTGRRPWAGESLYTVIYRQKHDPLLPIDWIREDVPPRLQYLIEGLLHKNPDRRWPSAARFLSLLGSETELPGIREWMAAVKRRQKSRAYTEARARGTNPISAVLDTVRFSRADMPADTPSGGTVVDPEEDAPPPELPFSAEDTQRIAPRDLAAAKDAVEQARQREQPAPPPRKRRLEYALLILTFLAGSAALAAVLWRENQVVETRREPASNVALRDRSSIEVPVMPPTASGGLDSMAVDSTTAAGAVVSSTSVPGATPAPTESARAGSPPLPAAGQTGSTTGGTAVATPPSTTARAGLNPPRDVADSARIPARPVVTSNTPPAGGTGRVTAPTPPPVTAPSSTPVTTIGPAVAFTSERAVIAAGGNHSCMIGSDGRARCWGNNERGQVGDGTFELRLEPTPVSSEVAFSMVSAGRGHSCGVARDGDAYCWGNNDNGQLGDGTTAGRSAPTRVSSGAAFRMVRAGQSHTCGMTRGGNLLCWGANAYGQLGDGTKALKATPVTVNLPADIGALAVGRNHTCAVILDGTAWCWGQNDAGQLGDGTTTDRAVPVQVNTDVKFISIAAGWFHTCGVATSGDAYCWGRNAAGQLGTGQGSALVPQTVESPSSFASVTAGSVHTCGRTRDGRALCWGQNTYGQLGDGSDIAKPRPVATRGGLTFAALSASASHTCGVTPSGEEFCWGYNIDGQVGSGDRDNARVPTRVSNTPR